MLTQSCQLDISCFVIYLSFWTQVKHKRAEDLSIFRLHYLYVSHIDSMVTHSWSLSSLFAGTAYDFVKVVEHIWHMSIAGAVPNYSWLGKYNMRKLASGGEPRVLCYEWNTLVLDLPVLFSIFSLLYINSCCWHVTFRHKMCCWARFLGSQMQSHIYSRKHLLTIVSETAIEFVYIFMSAWI